MEVFWRKAESFWNGNRTLAWVLVLIATGFALWTGFVPQSPGVAIGLLAGAAGIMSVRPKMRPAEKFAWVAVLVSFTVLEIVAIGRADKAAEATRENQNEAFRGIANGLKTSISEAKNHYDSTISHVDSVLGKTEQVAGLTKENLATASHIEQQEVQTHERADEELCHAIDHVTNDPGVSGFTSFQRTMWQNRSWVGDDEADKEREEKALKEVQEDADHYLRIELQPELQRLVPRIRARLGIPEYVRHSYLTNVLNDSSFSPGEINGALNELEDMRQQICPAPTASGHGPDKHRKPR